MTQPQADYTVLSRRYRPQTFDDVVGQQPVAQALKNAIQSDRVAHAYLFTGARGVGKTSMARILAKALNCPHVKDGVPCNQCEICIAISEGQDVDILEIDGASNRGIDDIRSLRANVGIRSMRTRIKMYIIDEVHMLTKEAFNALLKTLEEPPPNVKFVFCTTEPNKVPDTILSRCQRFDFASIESQRIIERLSQISEQEQIAVTPAAIELVAQRAAGSMRDSQSLFDQLLAFGGDPIDVSDVHRLFGTASQDRLIDLITQLSHANSQEIFQLIDSSVHEGVQLGNLLDQLMGAFRDLLAVISQAEPIEFLVISRDRNDDWNKLASGWTLNSVLAALEILSETKLKSSRITQTRVLVELALVRISQLKELNVLPELIAQMQAGSSHLTIKLENQSQPATDPAPPVEKKNEPAPVIEQETQVPEQKIIKFSNENLKDIWSQLLSSADDTVSHHIKGSCEQAIIAPNRLDVSFNSSYAFSVSYFEQKPEVVRQLEQQLQEITQSPIKIQIRRKSEPQITPEQEPISKAIGQDSHEHPMVKSAESIFGASIGSTERKRVNSQSQE